MTSKNTMKSWSKMTIGGLLIMYLIFAFSCSQKSTESKQTQPIIAEMNIPVAGMTCGSCEHHIETEVKREDGIIEIKADHEKALAFVKFDSSKISLDEIVVAINKTGYKATKP